jgi:1,4-dihydroxy-6-naphthoate synthase
MFDAIANGKINIDNHQWHIHLHDVEVLNKSAFDGKYDVTKLSFNAYSRLIDQYQLLSHGSALGRGCGPLIISGSPMDISDLTHKKVAIPGKNTTAFMLLRYAVGDLGETVEMLFSDIEAAILSGEVDAGLIIHESRFTYEYKGLHKVIDLGEYWEKTTGYPIPLGGIAVKRSLPTAVKTYIQDSVSQSVERAFALPDDTMEYVRFHAQEMEEKVIKSHIDLYVNDFSRNLGDEGKAAVDHLLRFIHGDQYVGQQIYIE